MNRLKKAKSFGFIAWLLCLAVLAPWLAAGTACACGEAGATDQTVLIPVWGSLVMIILGMIFETPQTGVMLVNSLPNWVMQAFVFLAFSLLVNRVQFASANGPADVPAETQQALAAYIKQKTALAVLDPDQADKWVLLGSATVPGTDKDLVESLVLVLPVPAKGKLSQVDPALKADDLLTMESKWTDKGQGLWSRKISLKDKYRADFNLIKIVWPVSLLKGASKTVPAAGRPLGAVSADDTAVVYIKAR